MRDRLYQLFVYGSLRKGFHHPAYRYISDHFHFVGEGKVKGLLYNMGEYPAALPTKEEQYIIGELYAINDPGEFGWAIAQLDDYEGVNPTEGEPALYRRDVVAVLHNNLTTEAWVYWYGGDCTGKPIIASGDVLAYRQGKNR